MTTRAKILVPLWIFILAWNIWGFLFSISTGNPAFLQVIGVGACILCVVMVKKEVRFKETQDDNDITSD